MGPAEDSMKVLADEPFTHLEWDRRLAVSSLINIESRYENLGGGYLAAL